MVWAVVSFVAVFLLLGSGLLLMFYREAMLQRISYVVNPRAEKQNLMGTIQQTGASLTELVGQFDRVLPKSKEEISVIEQRLIRAGYREHSAVQVFYGMKVITPILLCLLFLAAGLMSASPFFGWAVGLGGGFILPDFWLGRMIARRQKSIRRGLPDALDFMVICIEAGLSLDAAVGRHAVGIHVGHEHALDRSRQLVLTRQFGRERRHRDVLARRIEVGVGDQKDRSARTAQGTMIQPISANQPSARVLGGGGDHGLVAHMSVVIATSDQNATRPCERSGLPFTYTTIATIHNVPSMSSVSGMEFQSPRPNLGEDPGHRGRSGA